MKLVHLVFLALSAPLFALAQPSVPAVPAVTPVASAPAEQAKKAPTCEKKEMKNGKCPKVFPKAPKPTDKQLQDAKKKADAKK